MLFHVQEKVRYIRGLLRARIDGRTNFGIGIIQRIVVYQVEVEAGLEFQPFKESDSRKVRPENSSRIRSDLSLGKVAGRFQLAVAPDGR